jgi:cytochrome b6-f complex iron-sulfur subunit
MTEELHKTRRGFLSWLLGGGALALLGSILYPVIKYIVPPPAGEANVSQIKLPFKLSDLAARPRRFEIFKFGKGAGIVFITPDGEVRALSAVCTHLGCLVQYRPKRGDIWCACHNGRYDLLGRNISGPPPRPLEEFVVHVNEATGTITVAKSSNA